jgi:hypothetical protein
MTNISSPVVMLVFNRPELTRAVLDQIRAARPPVLLIVADGPRPGHPTDAKKCAEVRSLIESGADWGAQLLTNYAESNLGLRARIASGLTWAFEQVDRAIILEDDCVPHPSFFPFCGELLEHYQQDTRVGVVAGDNFQPQPFACEASYYYSRYPHCWGWATWRRAWKYFDEPMAQWPALKATRWLESVFPDPLHAGYWEDIFDRVHQRKINSWAYVWTFCCWSQHLLTVLPTINLVKNIGTGDQATNTKDEISAMHNLAAGGINFPLRHPLIMLRDWRADDYSQRHLFGAARPKTVLGKARRLLKKCLPTKTE